MPVADGSVLPRSSLRAPGLGFQLGHVQDDDFAPFQTNDASVNKAPEVARNQITNRANLRADLLIGFFQGKLEGRVECGRPISEPAHAGIAPGGG